MKLLKRQQEVVDFLKEGWELAYCSGYSDFILFQKDGIGNGGESKKVNKNTLNSLYLKGIIVIDKNKQEISTTYYKLNDALCEKGDVKHEI